MCCEVLPQYTYVLRAYLTVKTYVLRGVLKRQTQANYNTGFGDIFTNPILEVWSMRHAFEARHAGALDRMFRHLSAVYTHREGIMSPP